MGGVVTALKKGLVHIYTGDGKGKSTAAFGLAVRASGAGLKVLIHQFIKGKSYCEIGVLKAIPNIKVKQCGMGCFIKKGPSLRDIECARAGLADVRLDIMSGRFDLVILEEINIALHLKLIRIDDVIDIIRFRPKNVELILTGRNCPKALYRCADYITDMREVKHPYQKGITSRRGIEC